MSEQTTGDLPREERKVPRVTKIVLTGGPGAGKTTAQSWIQNHFPKLGYTVLFIPETATELISGGVAPWTCGTNLDYQRGQMRLQLEKEGIFERAARTMDAEKILIVCDRGAMDNRAYMTDGEFARLLSEMGLTEAGLRDSYDAVFHMVTAARGAEAFYTTENNKARLETPEEAISVDDRLLAAWKGHPHLRVIDNSTDFTDKLKRVVAEIRSFLGEPEPMEVERKFLIEYPDVRRLESLPGCRRVDITQTYLLAPAGEEICLRKLGENGSSVYYMIHERDSGGTRIRMEEQLNRNEYMRAMMEADPAKRPIRKKRYGLTYREQYFEIDVYPFWKDRAVVETGLRRESDGIDFPPELKVIREITEDREYSNASLAAPGGAAAKL